MKVLVIALGSHGDVHPFVGLARELRQRGHQVTFVAHVFFQSFVEQLGFKFRGVGSPEEFEEVVGNPDLWHPTKGFRIMAEVLIRRPLRPIYNLVREHFAASGSVVVAPFSAFGARIAQEKHGTPLVTVHLQPSLLRSNDDAPELPLPRLPRFCLPLTRLLNRAVHALADRFLIDRELLPTVNGFRQELGLPPARRFFQDWMHSPDLVIGLFPDWFGAPQWDWPPQIRLTGFPLYDEQERWEDREGLEEFLAAGEPPIVFAAGSANRHAAKFFEVSVKACEALGKRGLIVTQFPDQLPPQMPPAVRHFDYVPFSRVLRRSAAMVHHGGIGTCAQALAAGIPQLVVPRGHDQPDNAERLRRLGVARAVLPPAYQPRRVARRLAELLHSPQVAANCRMLAQRMAGSNAAEETCRLIEEYARRCSARPDVGAAATH